MSKSKLFLRFFIAVILFIPCSVIVFFLGGVDALAGTDLHERFYDFVDRAWNKKWK
jgi:hypothetical protein